MVLRILFFAIGFGLLQLSGVRAEDFNPVVGKAGDFVLRESDVDRLIGYQTADNQKRLSYDQTQKKEFVKQLLLTRVVADKARAAGFDKKPEVKEQLGYVVDQFLAQLYLDKVVSAEVTVSEEDMKKYYEEHKKELVIPESIKVRQIFIDIPNDASPDLKGKAKTKADDILEKLRKGGDFSKLAKEFSQDTESAANGGDIGWISPGKTNSKEFEAAIFKLKTGELGEVETPFGIHIVRVDDRKEQRIAAFEEARGYIQNRLKVELDQKKVTDYLDKLSKEYVLEEKPATKN
jgi:peptidyl-prolyl cis-trans isomerase C